MIRKKKIKTDPLIKSQDFLGLSWETVPSES